MGRIVRFGAFALALLTSISGAEAGDFRILHAEAISARAADITAESDPEGKSRLSFQAFGQQFDLELESNRRLLAGLPSRQKISLDQYTIYRGSLSGHPGSWIRLTRIGEELHGAFWDGTDLYTVLPARSVEMLAAQSLNTAHGALAIFRLADVESPFGGGSCAVGPRQQLDGAGAYQALVAELREHLASASLPTDQIELAVIADRQFRNLFPFNTQGQLLAIINVVDGIFSDQVGVTLVVPEFRILTDADDPFTTNDPELLLNALGVYRESTPEIRDRGLAHLITGRDLDLNTLGIAFVDSLCEPFGGVGLSEGRDSFAALITAHELGHNFGAYHDGEAGTPCERTLPDFLMSPFLNGSSEFSQCSLDVIRPRVQAAACITPAQVADAAVRVTPTPVSGVALQSLTLPIEVSSLGSIESSDVVVTATVPSGFTFESATVPGGTCIRNDRVRCELGTLAVGSTRRIDIVMRTNQRGTYQSEIELTSSNDRDRGNNTLIVPIVIDAEADAAVSVSASPLTGFTGQPLDFAVTIRSAGPQAVNDVLARVTASGFGLGPLQLVSAAGGACTSSGSQVECTFAPIASGESRVINLRATPQRPGTYIANARVIATNDGNSSNDLVFFGFSIAASFDASIQLVPQNLTTAINAPFTFSALVLSVGPQPVENVSAQFTAFQGAIIEAANVGGVPCVAQANGFTCSFGTLAPGAERRVDLQARATALGAATINANVSASLDEMSGNDSRQLNINVREAVDIALSTNFSLSVYETRTAVLNFHLLSRGINPATDIVATADIPAGLTVLSAQLPGGTCTTTGGLVRCTLASLAPGPHASVTLSLRGEQIGSYSATLSVTANGDADASNNSASHPILVVPFTDVGLDALPQNRQLLLDEVWELPLIVRTSVQPVNDVTLDLFLSGVSFESVTSAAGTCTISQGRVFCQMATLPAGAATAVTIRARAAVAGVFSSSARVSAPTDADPGNNIRSGSIVIDERGDATLEPEANIFTTAFGQQLQYGFRVAQVGTQRLSDVRVDVSVPTGVTIDTATSEGGPCTASGNSVSCVVGELFSGNKPRVRVFVRAQNTGTFQSTATVTARNDVNAQNNSSTVSLTFNTPAPPPSSGGGGGGGGGGSLGWLLVTALLTLTAWRRYPAFARPLRRSQRISHRPSK